MSERTVFDLSPAEKLQLVEDLWGDLHADRSQVPVTEDQMRELDRRKANLQSHPETGLSWQEVRFRVRARQIPKLAFQITFQGL